METKNKNLIPQILIIAVFVVGLVLIYRVAPPLRQGFAGQAPLSPITTEAVENSSLDGSTILTINPEQGRRIEEKVFPEEIVLPVRWGDLGYQMAQAGVIDKQKFEELYESRGGLSVEEKKLLEGLSNGNLVITQENSGYVLNLLWAFGLGNKNPVLEEGPMVTYDGGEAGLSAEALAKAGRFASTGGWTLAKGGAMDHYSKHSFVVLTTQQQAKVEHMAKNIYRPCCGNSTYFPDCNHGMAMLGLLELLAANGVSEGEMYKIALQVNSYWFPQTYLTLAKYFEMKGVSWDKVDAKEVLGFDFSSASGYQKILTEITPANVSGGGSCGA
ncbi:hypothetical protein A3A09_01900 [Candidatus Nomurabacteria bacterium RIFCSPLOWO2_01_FULL_42_20]|uniref:Uncharacterized protein n=1 Tax=Candidatus Nomurabacteria bacterium RIFCSPHIGHO2_01_FULL_42_16 TaxID=1801743 RepID=A0A1F6VHA2_9BACT|nr:MAG: hypothetical protein A2824_02835 [Candidatus Nomurabacteria bacterium RIFCSPHIGHO2_01_FULL_42_16]OGI91373.1 MAG: hypothetical protein A3A09_01900 [Candidatus Nomurabacteria bacterium RIFCSPLOWO2_01_FULL_42_20]